MSHDVSPDPYRCPPHHRLLCERGSAKCKHNVEPFYPTTSSTKPLFLSRWRQFPVVFRWPFHSVSLVTSCFTPDETVLLDHHIAIFKFLLSKNAPLNQQNRQLQLLFLEITLFNAPVLYVFGCWKMCAPAPSDKRLSTRGTSTRSRRLAVSQSRDAVDSGCQDFSFPRWHFTEIKLLIPLLDAFLRPHLNPPTFLSELNFRDWSQYRHRHWNIKFWEDFTKGEWNENFFSCMTTFFVPSRNLRLLIH